MPVLSKEIARKSARFSKVFPDLKRIPFFAPFDIAAKVAGVAEATKAQGEATTNKTIPR